MDVWCHVISVGDGVKKSSLWLLLNIIIRLVKEKKRVNEIKVKSFSINSNSF